MPIPILNFDNLPLEIQREILIYLNPKELIALGRVSRYWHEVAILDPILSKKICFKKEYQQLEVWGLTIGDIFLHTSFGVLKEEWYPLHPFSQKIQELSLFSDAPPEKKAWHLYKKAEEDIYALKAIVLSPDLHALVLTHSWAVWNVLLVKKLPNVPEIVPAALAHTDLQKKLDAGEWNAVQMGVLYELIAYSEKIIVLLLTKQRFKLLKQRFFSNYYFGVQLLAQQYLNVAYLCVQDANFRRALSARDCKLLERSHPEAFSFVKYEEPIRQQGIESVHSKLETDSWLLVMEDHAEYERKATMQEEFTALQANLTIKAFLKEQGCSSFNMFLARLMLGAQTVLFEQHFMPTDAKDFLCRVQVVWVKLQAFSIHYLWSPNCRDYISKKEFTLSEMLQLSPEKFSRVCNQSSPDINAFSLFARGKPLNYPTRHYQMSSILTAQ